MKEGPGFITLRKIEAAREIAEKAAAEASAARKAASDAKAASERAKQAADDAVEESRQRLKEAEEYLQELQSRPGSAKGLQYRHHRRPRKTADATVLVLLCAR